MAEAHAELSLDSLPRELLHRICAASDRSDIPSLRLVCRAIGEVADEHLKEQLSICYLRESINVPLELAHRGILSGVRSLNIDSHRLIPYWSFNKWFSTRDHGYGREERIAYDHQRFEDFDEIVNSYVEYRRLCEDEAAVLLHCTMRVGLCALFKSAPRLNDITVNLRSLMRRSRARPAYQKALVKQFTDDDVLQCEALTELLLAAHDVDRKIKRLEACDLPPGFFAQTSANLEKFASVLDELEEFTLDIGSVHMFQDGSAEVDSGSEDDDHDDHVPLQSFDYGSITRFMTLCQRSRKLALYFPRRPDTLWGLSSLQSFVGSITFSNLTDLTLCDFTGTQKELEAMLLRHKLTLRMVSLCRLKFIEGRWGDFFTAISCEFPNIKRGVGWTNFKLSGEFVHPYREDEDDDSFNWDGEVYYGDYSDKPDNAFTKRAQNFVRSGGSLPNMRREDQDYWPHGEEDSVHWLSDDYEMCDSDWDVSSLDDNESEDRGSGDRGSEDNGAEDD